MDNDRPLLSLTIPTFNRSIYLAELLECLLPQFQGESRAELIISDNASPDDTQQIVEGFRQRGLRCIYIRNSENAGADANFLQCLNLANGKYVWIMGDDDLIAPYAVQMLLSLIESDGPEDYDLIYLSSIGFSGTHRPTAQRDVLGRFAGIVTDGEWFLENVNALIGLISANIVNKDRLKRLDHPPIERLNDTNLIQVGWLFPVIHRRCRVLYVYERILFYRHFNSGGWGICEVFGLRLHRIANTYFANEPSLSVSLMNGVLRFWLPDVIIEMRRGRQQAMNAEDFAHTLSPAFARNWRYWLFVYLVAVPPLPVARSIHGVNRLVNRGARASGAVVRHLFGKPEPARPDLLRHGVPAARGKTPALRSP